MRPKKHVLVYSPSEHFLMLSHVVLLLRLDPKYAVTAASTESELLAAENPTTVLMLCPNYTEEEEHVVWRVKNAFPDATVILTAYPLTSRPTAADILSFSFDAITIRNLVRLATQRKRGPKKRAA